MWRIGGKGGRGQRADVLGGCLHKQSRRSETLPDTGFHRYNGDVHTIPKPTQVRKYERGTPARKYERGTPVEALDALC